MSKSKHQPIILEIVPTIFPVLNKKLDQDPAIETGSITVQRMKHKHIRKMQTLSDEEQVQYVMTELTGLSAEDIDELDAEDSAQLSEVIFGFMKKYAEIAKDFM